jgi:hypothetical protein
MPKKPDQAKQFSQAAAQPRTGLLCEVAHFLAQNKKWWLLPILVVLLLLGVLVLLGGTGVAPFIYTLF